MTQSTEWFAGSKKGLEGIARRRGLSYVLFELIQNCWDTGAKEVSMTFTPIDGRPLVDVIVSDDDPDGFRDLTHAWTLFAESERKSDPEKRGRFNLGEKLVLAVCESAEIVSTKGSVLFDERGRHSSKRKTKSGTCFRGRVKMTRGELEEVLEGSKLLISPSNVSTTINGRLLTERAVLKEFEIVLPTEIANSEGILMRCTRKTLVRVYEHIEPSGWFYQTGGWLYEMGIPVCLTGDKWDVEVMQKVPVNLERNSVSEAYLRTIRVSVLNEMFEQLTPEDASTPLVQEALTDERCKPEAVNVVLTHQYGAKRAVFDPNDIEANNRLVADGYKLIHGGAFSKPAWENIRSSGAALPSGQLRPTPKPYSDDPNAPARKLLPEEQWTPGILNIASYCTEVAWKLLGRSIRITIDKGHITDRWVACYGNAGDGVAELTFNLSKMGYAAFEDGPTVYLNSLLIHELAHDTEANHLSEDFYRTLQKLGAELTALALRDPDLFKRHGWTTCGGAK